MKKRPLILSVIIAVAMIAIGYASISASHYSDVSSLKNLSRDTRVTVQGENLPLGTGSLAMVYKGRVFNVDARGSYAVATDPQTGESYALFVLRGKDNSLVAALYPAKEFVTRYGGSPIIESTIVVDGVYKPGERVVIYQGGAPLLEAGVIEVQNILKGCHASYGQEQATLRQ